MGDRKEKTWNILCRISARIPYQKWFRSAHMCAAHTHTPNPMTSDGCVYRLRERKRVKESHTLSIYFVCMGMFVQCVLLLFFSSCINSMFFYSVALSVSILAYFLLLVFVANIAVRLHLDFFPWARRKQWNQFSFIRWVCSDVVLFFCHTFRSVNITFSESHKSIK